MVDRALQDLKSGDAAQRRQAIITLADCDDPRVLPTLEKAAQHDPEPVLRALAQKAKLHAERRRWRQAADTRTPDPPAAPAIDSAGESAEDKHRRDMARTYLSSALAGHENEDRLAMITALLRALELDPDLKTDPDVARLAAAYTGETPSKAVAALLSGVAKSKSRSPNSIGTLSTWIALELLLLWFLETAAVVSYFMMLRQNPVVLKAFGLDSNQFSLLYPQLQRIMSMSTGGIIGSAALYSVGSLISSLIMTCIMFAGGVMIGGTGNIFDFLNRILRIQLVTVALETVLLIVFALVGRNGTISRDVSNLLGTLTLVLLLGSALAMAYHAAKAHDFSFLRGILTIFSPGFIVCGCLFLAALLRQSPT